MATFNYTISGTIEVPDGKLNDTGTGILFGDNQELKLWEQVEVCTVGEDDHENLSYDECSELGIFYDGDMASIEEAE